MGRTRRDTAGLAALFALVTSTTVLLVACNPETTEGSKVSNCDLLSGQEAAAMAGFELVAGEGTILGCPFTLPGDLTAQMIVGAANLEGESLRERAERGYPQAADIIAVEGADNETLAVLTPTGGTVAAVIAARDGTFVELAIFMLGIEPGDTDEIRLVADYAQKALARAVD